MGENGAKQPPVLTKYLTLSRTNKTVRWIVAALVGDEGMGFNELFNHTLELRLEAEPQQKRLSKTTFSAAMKELQEIGAVLKEPSKKHRQAFRFTFAQPLLDEFRLVYDEYVRADKLNVNEAYDIFKSVDPRAAVVFIGDLAFGHLLSAFKFSIEHPGFTGERLYLMLQYLEVFGRAFAKLSINDSGEYIAAFKELNEKWVKFRNIEYPDVNDEILKAGGKGLY